MIILLVVPICMVIRYSFLDKAVVSPDPQMVGVENYATLFADSQFWNAVSNTIIFVVVSVIAHLVIGMVFAML